MTKKQLHYLTFFLMTASAIVTVCLFLMSYVINNHQVFSMPPPVFGGGFSPSKSETLIGSFAMGALTYGLFLYSRRFRGTPTVDK